MAVRPILKMGDPRLLRQSVPLPPEKFGTPELETLLADMFETMTEANGAGLAAPQIGLPVQVVIFGFEDNDRYPDAPAIPKTVLINPKITPLSDSTMESWEGCLSIPGMRGMVPRWTRIRYEGFDQQGNPINREAEGFHALVVQHECDHLEGILYPMRMKDLTQFGFEDAIYNAYAKS